MISPVRYYIRRGFNFTPNPRCKRLLLTGDIFMSVMILKTVFVGTRTSILTEYYILMLLNFANAY